MVKEAKINAKAVIKETKTEKIQKRNVTFRLDPANLEKFFKICEREKVSGNKVIETLIKKFLDSYRE